MRFVSSVLNQTESEIQVSTDSILLLQGGAGGITPEVSGVGHRILLFHVVGLSVVSVGHMTCTAEAGCIVIISLRQFWVGLCEMTVLSFLFCRYFLNVIFNILNKKIYNYFPYP